MGYVLGVLLVAVLAAYGYALWYGWGLVTELAKRVQELTLQAQESTMPVALVAPDPPPSPSLASETRALALYDRHGILRHEVNVHRAGRLPDVYPYGGVRYLYAGRMVSGEYRYQQAP